MGDAELTGFGFGFPFVRAAPPHRAEQAPSDSLASPSQQQPWRLNPKIVGLFSALLCWFNRWSVCSGFQRGCQAKWWFLWCTHLTARNWNKTTNLFRVSYWITAGGFQLSVATSPDRIQTNNLKEKWSLTPDSSHLLYVLMMSRTAPCYGIAALQLILKKHFRFPGLEPEIALGVTHIRVSRTPPAKYT